MKTLQSFVQNIEVYSIDEAFLDLTTMVHHDFTNLGCEIRQAVKSNVGLPVTIGIAKTKTLAKIANRYAKKRMKSYQSVPNLFFLPSFTKFSIALL